MGSHHLVPKYARPNSTPKRSAGAAPCPMSCAPRMMAAVPAPGLTVRCQPLCHALTATVLCLGATRAMGQGKALQHLGGLQEGWGAHSRGRGVRMGRSLSPAQCRPLPAPHEGLLSPGLHCTSCLRGHLPTTGHPAFSFGVVEPPRRRWSRALLCTTGPKSKQPHGRGCAGNDAGRKRSRIF